MLYLEDYLESELIEIGSVEGCVCDENRRKNMVLCLMNRHIFVRFLHTYAHPHIHASEQRRAL